MPSNKTIIVNGQKQKVSYSNNILSEEVVPESKSKNGKKVKITVKSKINDYPEFTYTWESYYTQKRNGVGHSQAFYVGGMKFSSEKKVFEFVANK